jgi:hypothetical protein
MSAICPTCGSKLSCGCQLRTASNGIKVCSLCISKYENQLANTRKSQIPTSPSQVSIKYIPPNTRPK